MANRDIGDSELNLEGYELFRKDRDIKSEQGNDKKGDCVVIYVKSELNPTDRTDIENLHLKNVNGLTYMLKMKKH